MLHVKKARNTYNRNKSSVNRMTFTRWRSMYNKVKKKAMYEYKSRKGKRVYNLAKSNPKCFWSALKKYYKKST